MSRLLLLTVWLGLVASGAAASALAAGDPVNEFGTPPLQQTVAPRTLREVLALTDGDRPLRLRLLSRETCEGYPWRVEADTLRLIPQAAWSGGDQAPARDTLVSVPVAEIAAVWQLKSGVNQGLSWGAKSGVVVGGGLGVLVGAALSALSDDDSDAAPILAAALLFSATGAAAGALVGGAVGALSSDWQQVWPPDTVVGPGDAAVGDAQRTRWYLEPGWAFRTDTEIDGQGPSVRMGLSRRLGRRFELGPGLEYHDVEGEALAAGVGAGPHLSARSRVGGLAMDLRACDSRTGLGPLATAGLGWFLGDSLYLGSHLGVGWRWRGRGDTELRLAIRRHLALTGYAADKERFWVVSAGATF